MRTLAVAALVCALTAGAVFLLNSGSRACNKGDEVGWVVVSLGDTLWTIATRVAPDADPRRIVDDIMERNGLASTWIRPGQRLLIPSAETVLLNPGG